jgi:hypothetical protein
MCEGGKQSFFTLLVQTFGLPDEEFRRLEKSHLGWLEGLKGAAALP